MQTSVDYNTALIIENGLLQVHELYYYLLEDRGFVLFFLVNIERKSIAEKKNATKIRWLSRDV
jgi:hypothetical protein